MSGFSEFLNAAEAKELPKDSVLIVENLIACREKPRIALKLFLRATSLGVSIVTLTDGEL